MEMYGNIRCVTYDELVGGGILTKHTYDWYVKENRLHVLRKGGGKGRPALLEYNSLPSKVRTEYDARNPEAKNELKQEIMSNILIRDDKAIVFFRDKYNLPDGSGLSDKKQEEYVLNAEVLNAMIRTESLVTAEHRKCGYNRRSEVWLKCVECCEDLRGDTRAHSAKEHCQAQGEVQRIQERRISGTGVAETRQSEHKEAHGCGETPSVGSTTQQSSCIYRQADIRGIQPQGGYGRTAGNKVDEHYSKLPECTGSNAVMVWSCLRYAEVESEVLKPDEDGNAADEGFPLVFGRYEAEPLLQG